MLPRNKKVCFFVNINTNFPYTLGPQTGSDNMYNDYLDYICQSMIIQENLITKGSLVTFSGTTEHDLKNEVQYYIQHWGNYEKGLLILLKRLQIVIFLRELEKNLCYTPSTPRIPLPSGMRDFHEDYADMIVIFKQRCDDTLSSVSKSLAFYRKLEGNYMGLKNVVTLISSIVKIGLRIDGRTRSFR